MKRQRLTDNPRRWIDLDRARRFPGTVRFDPTWGTWRSRATGDLYSHEDLYRTASGRWVVHWWSLWSGKPPLLVEITPQEAAGWLERCGYLREANELRKGGRENNEEAETD